MILGISVFAANFLWGILGERFATTTTLNGTVTKVIDYHRLFLVPFGLSLLAAVLLAVFFHPPEKRSAPADETV
jgi:hypothetical protein